MPTDATLLAEHSILWLTIGNGSYLVESRGPLEIKCLVLIAPRVVSSSYGKQDTP